LLWEKSYAAMSGDLTASAWLFRLNACMAGLNGRLEPQEISMASSKQGSSTEIRSSGRGFTSVDPERQREIDDADVRRVRDRAPAEPWRQGRPAQSNWFVAPRDPADEGGSSRRSR
jgi:hypothetical protein